MTREELDALNAISRTQLATLRALAKIAYLSLENVEQEKVSPVTDLLTKAIDSLDETIAAIRKAVDANARDSRHG